MKLLTIAVLAAGVTFYCGPRLPGLLAQVRTARRACCRRAKRTGSDAGCKTADRVPRPCVGRAGIDGLVLYRAMPKQLPL